LLEENVRQLLADEESDEALGIELALIFATTLEYEGREIGEVAGTVVGIEEADGTSEAGVDAGD
jgi:hypothetical protein